MPISDDAMTGAREMLDLLSAENAELRRQRDEAVKMCARLLVLAPVEKTEDGGYPSWLRKLLEEARAIIKGEHNGSR